MAQGQLAPSAPAARPEPGPRDDGRDYKRVRVREPSEKYHLGHEDMKRGMDYFWGATTIRGMPNPRFADYYRAGWRPVRADEFPELSGIDLDVPESIREYLPQVTADGPIVRDGQMLMTRPLAMSQQAKARLDQEATDQVDNYLRTQRTRSERAIGAQRTRMSRTYGPADEAPLDQEVEMG